MDALLTSIRPRVLLLVMVSLVLLVAGALCANVLMPQYKDYRKADRDRAELARVVGSGEALRKQISGLRADVDHLTRRLHGDMANLPDNQLEAFIIGRLQRISWQNSVELVSVKPRDGQVVQVFREMLFDVEISGDYFDLFVWLQSLAKELGFVVVKRYIIRPLESGKGSPRLSATLTIASYRKGSP
jgi:Tfp pilus assembly protein PilO